MSNRRLDLTADARRDIRAILRYSRKAWGEQQRDAYARNLLTAMDQLTRFPELDQSRNDLSPGLRGRPVGQHVIYYRVDIQAVTVIRLLHTRMEAAGQFDV